MSQSSDYDELFELCAPPKREPSELERVIALERTDPQADSPDYTPAFALEPSARLSAAQNKALEAIRTQHARGLGAILSLGVGHGKTLIGYLIAPLLEIEPSRVLILLPASTRKTFIASFDKLGALFKIPHPDTLNIVSYEDLSSPNKARILEQIGPLVIYADEAHKLRNPKSARTARLLRYLDAAPDCRFIAASGTLFRRKIAEAEPILRRALKDGSPLPRAYTTLAQWADCLDADAYALRSAPWYTLATLVRAFGAVRAPLDTLSYTARQDAARAAYSARFEQTRGVVTTSAASFGGSLRFERIARLELPAIVSDALRELRATWALPDGSELADHLRVASAARQLALGYYLSWTWQDATPDAQWLATRAEWGRELRAQLARRTSGLDSPALIVRALESGWSGNARLMAAWLAWRAIEQTATPASTPVILSDAPLEQIAARARKMGACLVWCAHTLEQTTLERYGVRATAPQDEPLESSLEPQSVSLAAHRDGRNFQRWSSNLIVSPPASGEAWQQLLGRTHRQGQDADEVNCAVLAHTPEFCAAIEKAKKDALFAQTILKEPQKILAAEW